MSDRLKHLLDDLEGFPADATIGAVRELLRDSGHRGADAADLMRACAFWRAALTVATREDDLPRITEYAIALKSTKDCLRSLLLEPSSPDLAAVLRDQTRLLQQATEQLARQNDYAKRVASVTSREAVRALADLISGQIASHGSKRKRDDEDDDPKERVPA